MLRAELVAAADGRLAARVGALEPLGLADRLVAPRGPGSAVGPRVDDVDLVPRANALVAVLRDAGLVRRRDLADGLPTVPTLDVVAEGVRLRRRPRGLPELRAPQRRLHPAGAVLTRAVAIGAVRHEVDGCERL